MALQPREGPSTTFLWPPFRRLGHVDTIYCNPIWVHLASFVSHLLMELKAVGKLYCIARRNTEYPVPSTYIIHRSRFSFIIVAIGSVQGLRLPSCSHSLLGNGMYFCDMFINTTRGGSSKYYTGTIHALWKMEV